MTSKPPFALPPGCSPAGPLSYLLMDRKGWSKLGVFVDKNCDHLVLIGKFAGRTFVFRPTADRLDGMMKNRIPVEKVLLTSMAGTSSEKTPGIFDRLLLRW